MPGPAFGPTTQAVEVFVHGLGERHRLAHRLENIVHRQLALCVEGIIQSTDDCLLDFGAAEVFAYRSQCLQVEVAGVASAPGQMHPEHWHTQKDETFHLLHGQIDLVLGEERRTYGKNDVVVIPRGVKHEFRSAAGAVIEEISSTHTQDDSSYTDTSIGPKSARKTYVTNWMD